MILRWSGYNAVNLAVALVRHCNMRVGLLDADVYGPSVPRLMNLSGRPKVNEGTDVPFFPSLDHF
jgi:ATP-binding protein involved in chromosome partitioning